MSYDIHVLAPAKVNLGLRVLPVRADGYHEIESIFQTIPLYDSVSVQTTDGRRGTCTVECIGMNLPEQNTVTIAYDAFCKFTGFAEPVHVCVEKGIPSGAGLGGGSSDAAALITALDVVFSTHLSASDKKLIAASVGSDVFFFLNSYSGTVCSGCAVVTGRGEEVVAIPSRKDLFFVVIWPEIHSSTREAYSLVDAWYAPRWEWTGPSATELETVYNNPVCAWGFVNSFTAPLSVRFPRIGQALQDLRRTGAGSVLMTGSGSAVFGVFDTSACADDAFLKLREKWKYCFNCTFS